MKNFLKLMTERKYNHLDCSVSLIAGALVVTEHYGWMIVVVLLGGYLSGFLEAAAKDLSE